MDERVTTRDELLQITCKRRRDRTTRKKYWRMEIQNAFNHSRLSPHTRWIKQNEIHIARWHTRLTNWQQFSRLTNAASNPASCKFQRAKRAAVGFDSHPNHSPKSSQQGQRKQTNTAIKINRTLTGHISQRKIDQRSKQRRIDLKERLAL